MDLKNVYSSTEVRKSWSSFVDLAQLKPIKISRNNKNDFTMLSDDFIELLLPDFKTDLLIEKDDDVYVGYLEEFELVTSDSSPEGVIEDLKKQLLGKAELIIEDLKYFAKDPEIVDKLPKLLKLYLFPEDLDTFIELKQEKTVE